MNEMAGTLENKHCLMTGPTETLVAQNLQDCKGYLLHILNITMLKILQSVTVKVMRNF